jgi:hypothetical protein
LDTIIIGVGVNVQTITDDDQRVHWPDRQ